MSRRPRAPSAPSNAAPGAGREKMNVSFAARAGARATESARTEIDLNKLFRPATPAPGVVPAGAGMALDSATDWAAWAGSASSFSTLAIGASLVAEGQTFLGFPLLSELAQRPEFRAVTDTIASDMTRKWIRFRAIGDADKSDRVSELEAAFKDFGIREKFKRIAEHDGFFGRGHLFIDTGAAPGTPEFETSIGDGWDATSAAKIVRGSLKRFRVIEPVWCYPSAFNASDPFSDDFYRMDYWYALGRRVHQSRLLTFVGREVPDMLKAAYSFAGLSYSQMVRPYAENFLRMRQSVTDIARAFTLMVLKTNMQSVLQGGDGTDVYNRIDIFNATRTNRDTVAVDKDTEDFTNVSAPLSGLDALQAQALEHMSSVSRIPLVKLTGISPSGLNASSDGEIRVYYDYILGCQHALFGSALHTVIGLVMRHLWGEADPDISFEFVPLWDMTEKEMAEIRKMNADTDQVLCDIGALSPEEVRIRVASDLNAPYAGLDVDATPEIDDDETIDPDNPADAPADGVQDGAFFDLRHSGAA